MAKSGAHRQYFIITINGIQSLKTVSHYGYMKCIMFQINNIVIKTMTFENTTKKKKKAKLWLSKEKGVVFKELNTRENR